MTNDTITLPKFAALRHEEIRSVRKAAMRGAYGPLIPGQRGRGHAARLYVDELKRRGYWPSHESIPDALRQLIAGIPEGSLDLALNVLCTIQDQYPKDRGQRRQVLSGLIRLLTLPSDVLETSKDFSEATAPDADTRDARILELPENDTTIETRNGHRRDRH